MYPSDTLLIVKNGNIILYDETLTGAISHNVDKSKFDSVEVDRRIKFAKYDIAGTIEQLRKYHIEIPFGNG